MSEKNLNINVSGGNINIGAVSQGDNNEITSHSQEIKTSFDKSIEEFLKSIINKDNIPPHTNEDQIDSLIAEVRAIQKTLENDSFDKPSILNKAKKLYEDYGWAADALKKMFATVVL